MQSITKEQLFNQFEKKREEELSVPDLIEYPEDQKIGGIEDQNFESLEDQGFDEMEII